MIIVIGQIKISSAQGTGLLVSNNIHISASKMKKKTIIKEKIKNGKT
jgi:hypothetical protein